MDAINETKASCSFPPELQMELDCYKYSSFGVTDAPVGSQSSKRKLQAAHPHLVLPPCRAPTLPLPLPFPSPARVVACDRGRSGGHPRRSLLIHPHVFSGASAPTSPTPLPFSYPPHPSVTPSQMDIIVISAHTLFCVKENGQAPPPTPLSSERAQSPHHDDR